MDETCKWDDCEDEQFEDWFYCESHANRMVQMNRFLSGVVGR